MPADNSSVGAVVWVRPSGRKMPAMLEFLERYVTGPEWSHSDRAGFSRLPRKLYFADSKGCDYGGDLLKMMLEGLLCH